MLRTQSDSYEKNMVNDWSIQVCFDQGLANLLLFHRYDEDITTLTHDKLSYITVAALYGEDVTSEHCFNSLSFHKK